MLTLYKCLLRFYPSAHRRNFSEEMITVFRELQAEARQQGRAGQFRFYLREASGFVMGAITEHWREFTKGRFIMRNEFRFPRTTWVLMTIILAGVVMAIAKGEAISVSVPPMAPALPPIHPARGLLSNWGLSFLIMYVIGVIVGGILFALRRKATLRFGNVGDKS
jgi:hypothetical protein